MYREPSINEATKKQEAHEKHEAPVSVESPEQIRQQMMGAATQETARFTEECATSLGQIEARAEKDGLVVDAEDKKALQELGVEADSAREELKTSLAEKIIKKLKTAATIGMAAMAFSGAGKFEEKQTLGDLGDVKATEWVNPDAIESPKSEVNKNTKYEKSIEDIPVFEQQKARKNLLESLELNSGADTEKILIQIRDHISSQEYLNKLQIEFGGDIEKAKKSQQRRIIYTDFVKISFSDKNDLTSEAIDTSQYNKWIPKWLALEIECFKLGINGAAGHYEPKDHIIGLPNDRDNYIVGRHEILHASTRGVYDMPESTKSILKDSYQKSETRKDTYLNNATEILVRKQALDFEMDKLGIKKYGERFTKEHYEKMMEHYEKGDFPYDINDFIETTKPEYFEKIFNEIADADNPQEQQEQVV